MRQKLRKSLNYWWVLPTSVSASFALLSALGYLLAGLIIHPPWYIHRPPELGLLPVVAASDRNMQLQGISRDPLRDFGITYQPVEFPSVDGSILRGWLVEPATPVKAKVGVVTVHSAGADRRDYLRHVPFLYRAGYTTLLFDCREHGISDGASRGVTLGVREQDDVTSAVHFLKRQLGYTRVAVLGTSQGGISAILAAAKDPEIDAVIAENASTRLQEWLNYIIREGFREKLTAQLENEHKLAVWGVQLTSYLPQWAVDFISTITSLRIGSWKLPEPIDAVSRIAPRPLFLMHGTGDAMIPFVQSEKLYAKAKEPKDLWIAEGAAHLRIYNLYPLEYQKRVLTFLRKWLPDPRGGMHRASRSKKDSTVGAERLELPTPSV